MYTHWIHVCIHIHTYYVHVKYIYMYVYMFVCVSTYLYIHAYLTYTSNAYMNAYKFVSLSISFLSPSVSFAGGNRSSAVDLNPMYVFLSLSLLPEIFICICMQIHVYVCSLQLHRFFYTLKNAFSIRRLGIEQDKSHSFKLSLSQKSWNSFFCW